MLWRVDHKARKRLRLFDTLHVEQSENRITVTASGNTKTAAHQTQSFFRRISIETVFSDRFLIESLSFTSCSV